MPESPPPRPAGARIYHLRPYYSSHRLPPDWREVRADIWLQSLTTYAYNPARLGHEAESLEALGKVEDLDPSGKLGASRLRQVSTASAATLSCSFPRNSRTDAFRRRRRSSRARADPPRQCLSPSVYGSPGAAVRAAPR
ncbi:hypothetical protein GCM10027514_18960 [Azotobacter armeniacus]